MDPFQELKFMLQFILDMVNYFMIYSFRTKLKNQLRFSPPSCRLDAACNSCPHALWCDTLSCTVISNRKYVFVRFHSLYAPQEAPFLLPAQSTDHDERCMPIDICLAQPSRQLRPAFLQIRPGVHRSRWRGVLPMPTRCG